MLPGFILLAVWASSWLVGRARRSGYDRVTTGALASLCVAALVLPAAMTTFGLKLKHGGPLGIRPTADGLAFQATYQGEISAVNGMCAAIPRDASVVFADDLIAEFLTEDVRGMCGVPAARMVTSRPGDLEQVVRGIEQAGRRPVILAGKPSELTPYGGPRQANHGAGQHPGRAHPGNTPRGHLAAHDERLDAGAIAMITPLRATAPHTAPAAEPVSVPSVRVPYVSIILPCFNEQDHVTAEVARICAGHGRQRVRLRAAGL